MHPMILVIIYLDISCLKIISNIFIVLIYILIPYISCMEYIEINTHFVIYLLQLRHLSVKLLIFRYTSHISLNEDMSYIYTYYIYIIDLFMIPHRTQQFQVNPSLYDPVWPGFIYMFFYFSYIQISTNDYIDSK